MPQPIAFLTAAKPAAVNLEQLRNARAEHALLSAYELLQILHDRGVLNLLRRPVSGGDALIGTMVAAMDTPYSIRAIRNFLLLTKFFANIPPDVFTSLVDAVSAGAEREKGALGPRSTAPFMATPQRRQSSLRCGCSRHFRGGK